MSRSDLDTAIFGAFATHALRLADQHNVFTHLIRKGPSSVPEMVGALTLDEDTLNRLVLVLSAFRVVRLEADNRYSVPADIAPYLDRDDSRYLGGFIRHVALTTTVRMADLDAYLTNGKPQASGEVVSPFNDIYRVPEETDEFLDAMWQLSFHVSEELATLAGLDDVRHLVDVGGASGAFCTAALRRYPNLRATVFDLPAVEPALEQTRKRYDLRQRLDFVSGDFFADRLPMGDCFAFGYILSDWSDETCLMLLRKAYEACGENGRVLVMERLFDNDMRGPLSTAAMNLAMHVETIGRHRTSNEYAALLSDAGFKHCETYRSSQDKHLVVGFKGAAS